MIVVETSVAQEPILRPLHSKLQIGGFGGLECYYKVDKNVLVVKTH
jgi:hypothetical protein